MRNVIDEMKSFQQFDFFNLDMYFCSVLLRSCLCSLVFRPYINCFLLPESKEYMSSFEG
jgi:hypothetical protein